MILQYDITVVGEQNIRRALRGVEAEIASSGKRAQAAAGKMPGSATVRRPTDRDAVVAARRVEREAVAAQKRIARQEATALKTSERDRLAAEKRVWAEKATQARRYAAIEIQENAKVQSKAKSDAKASAKSWTNTAQNVGRGVGGSVGGAMRTVAGIGGTVLGVAGLAGAGEAVSQEIGLDQRIRQVAVNSRQPGETAMSHRELRSQVRNTSVDTGVSESGLVSAVETYTARTGDIKTATANLRTFATVAMATGASVEDVASTAADLAQKFNITKPKEMADAFAVLAFQGKKGAFELRDMASTFPEMAAAAQRAGMKGVGGMKTLGGLAQIARQSTGSGAEASTALQMMMTQMIAKAGALKSGKALGGKQVNVFEGGDATKDARDIRQVLAEIISKSHGNLTQLGELFDVRGIRAASPLVSAYRGASEAAGGGSKGEAAGKAAVLKAIADASDAVVSFSDVMKDSAEVQQSDAVKLEKINTRLREAFSSSLLPALERMMPQFENLIPKVAGATEALAGIASWAVSNPLGGLGAIVSAAVAKDLASAAIGEAAKRALATSVGQGAGLLIGVAAITAATINLVQGAREVDANKRSDAMQQNSEDIRAQAAQEMGSSGHLSAETRTRLERLRERESKRLSDEGDPTIGHGVLHQTASMFGELVGLGNDASPIGPKHIQKTVDMGRAPEIIHSKAEADKYLLLDEVARKIDSAGDKMKAAADKIASVDTARTKPIVGR